MNTYDIKRLALVLQVQAEIEGMKAENEKQKYYNDKPTTRLAVNGWTWSNR